MKKYVKKRNFLTDQEHLAITLLVTGQSPREIAAEVGLTERQIRRRIEQDELFREEIRKARSRVRQHITSQIRGNCKSAVAVLVRIMHNKDYPASAQVAASRALLDYMYRDESDELLRRLEKLERTIGETA